MTSIAAARLKHLGENSRRCYGGHGASQRKIAISIPDWGATPYAEGRDRALISREVMAYNEHAKALALKAGAHWIDVTEVSRAMLTDQTLVAVDGLHPTGVMYKQWAELIAPTALAALSS
jgi:hypothetical protein